MVGVGMAVGAGLGLGLLLLVRGVVGAPPPLADALTGLHQPRPNKAPEGRLRRLRHRLVMTTRRGLDRVGVDLDRLHGDLAMCESTIEAHLLKKLGMATAGMALPVVAGVILNLAALHLPLQLLAVGTMGLGVAGFVLPDVLVRARADARRRAFDYALSSYLDLVRVILAAGAGVETALRDAAEAGQGPAFRRLRSALATARVRGETPWARFGQLGEELDLPALRETAASLALAGTQGAKLRDSLAARAEALRSRDLARMEAAAQSATERMSVPSVVLVVAFIVFVGFPAAVEILAY